MKFRIAFFSYIKILENKVMQFKASDDINNTSYNTISYDIILEIKLLLDQVDNLPEGYEEYIFLTYIIEKGSNRVKIFGNDLIIKCL